MKTIAMILIASFATAAIAQDDAAKGNPVGLEKAKTWTVDLGYSRDYLNRKNLTYYKLTFRGNTIGEGGSMLTPKTIGGAWDIPKTGSDSDDFHISLQDGIGQLTSPLFKAFGVKQFGIGGDFFKFLRGAVNVSGKLIDDQRLNIGVGLETKPITPLLNTGLGLTNHFQLGVFGEKATGESVAKDQADQLLFTYRAYVGRGFGYVSSKNLEKLRDDLVRQVEKLNDDQLTEMVAKGSGVEGIDIALAAVDRRVPGWQKLFRDGLGHFYMAQRDQPTFSVEFSAEGSYAPIKFEDRRYNALYGATFRWWPDPHHPDDLGFSITYQNGYDRGAPADNLTGLIISVGFKF